MKITMCNKIKEVPLRSLTRGDTFADEDDYLFLVIENLGDWVKVVNLNKAEISTYDGNLMVCKVDTEVLYSFIYDED